MFFDGEPKTILEKFFHLLGYRNMKFIACTQGCYWITYLSVGILLHIKKDPGPDPLTGNVLNPDPDPDPIRFESLFSLV